MRAIVIQQYGAPEQLVIKELPKPEPINGTVVIKVKAFGLNRAELYMRRGLWGEVAKVTGLECVGVVDADPSGKLAVGQTVAALMGGMGRTIDGSYAEYTRVPTSNVVPLHTTLSWENLAAIPESYATAWSCLVGNLALAAGQTLLIRGATSALGHAAINIASHLGVTVIATTRNELRAASLKQLGVTQVLIESTELSKRIRELHPEGIDAVLDLIGNTTILDSLAAAKRNGRVCVAGFLGGGVALNSFDPLFQIPSGIHLSSFASAFTFGRPEWPLSDIPLQTIAERVAAGIYHAQPAHIFEFNDIIAAHHLMESNEANGKLVVRL